MPSFCANIDTSSPAATVTRFTALTSTFPPATAEMLSCAATCTPRPDTMPIDAGALASKPGAFNPSSSSLTCFCASVSAGTAFAVVTEAASAFAISSARSSCAIVACMSSCWPAAFGWSCAEKYSPLPARSAPQEDVRISNPSPRFCFLESTRYPRFNWLLPECSVESLMLS